jgi:cytosolic carboxypeptidase protein 6
MNLSIKSFTITAFLSLILFTSCRTAAEFTGYDYDPEGVTETYDREIDRQSKRTIGFRDDGVWISNEFYGSRVNDIERLGRHHYRLIIKPEISPVNNSPWYGFQVWSDQPTEVTLELAYSDGRHRYRPAISRDKGANWAHADSTIYTQNRDDQTGILKLVVDEKPLWVSAQIPHTTRQFRSWTDQISQHSFVQKSVAGSSHEGRPIYKIKYSEQSDQPVKGVILVYGRQHPPEVPGYLVGLEFLDALADSSELARTFRSYFDVWAFPMMNPDGSDNGHWRTNAGGVDLNRDWQFFNQPETSAVRDALLPLLDRRDRKVFYAIDFHSTGRSVFYPILEEIETFPHLFTYRWYDAILEAMPRLELGIQAFPTESPIAKNWSYKTFGIDAVTFEVWDELPDEQIEEFGRKAAKTFMKLMIAEYEQLMGEE